jgi:hypothetical protein
MVCGCWSVEGLTNRNYLALLMDNWWDANKLGNHIAVDRSLDKQSLAQGAV